MRAVALRLTSTRGLQVGFIVLMVTCLVQTLWWILDNAHFTTTVRDDLLAAAEHELREAEGLLAAGVSKERIEQLLPRLQVTPQGPAIHPDYLASLERDRRRRLVRYGWEGTFFLVVLAGGVVVLVRALGQQARLHRRQQNFIAAVSHELKSPLASIRLSAETLSLRDPPPERRTRLVGRILEDVDRLERMITNILQVRKIEEGRLALVPQPLVLADVIRGVLEELGPTLEERGVTIEQDVPPDLKIQADPVGVHSVLRNLLDNAAKAVADAADRTVSVRAARDGRGVEVRVRDRGAGFPPEEAQRLFQKFYRLGDELVRTTKGSGLGLYLSRRLVELDRGSISAHSEGPGAGAEFRVTWLLAEAVEAQAGS